MRDTPCINASLPLSSQARETLQSLAELSRSRSYTVMIRLVPFGPEPASETECRTMKRLAPVLLTLGANLKLIGRLDMGRMILARVERL